MGFYPIWRKLGIFLPLRAPKALSLFLLCVALRKSSSGKKYIRSIFNKNITRYNYKFTRKVEIKHVTKQKSPYSVISKEYPNSFGEPYYPINDKENIKVYEKYKNLISKLAKQNIFFEGRLATYRYLNTDEVIEQALKLFDKIKKKIK